MKLLSKEEIETQYGKYGYFSTAKDYLIDLVKYIAGIDVFDDLLDEKQPNKSAVSTILSMLPKGIMIELNIPFKKYKTALGNDQIKEWSIQRQNNIAYTKKKSVVGRAVVGGLLLGPVGAIVGGMSGVKDKEIKIDDADNIVTCVFEEDGKEKAVLFSCKNKHLKEVNAFLERNYRSIYKGIITNEVAK